MTTYTVAAGESVTGAVLKVQDTQDVFGMAIDTIIISASQQMVRAGGHAIHATIQTGGTQYVYGVADYTIDDSEQHVFGGGIANFATVRLLQYVEGGGKANGTTVTAGGIQTIYSGGTASSTTIEHGWQTVDSGATASDTIINGSALRGSYQRVYGTATNTTINGLGEQYVDTGGSANYTTINGGAAQYVIAGTADHTTITQGIQIVNVGASATNTTIASLGKQEVHGTATNTIIDGGLLDLWGNAIGTIEFGRGGTLLVEQPIIADTSFAASLVHVAVGDVIDLRSLLYYPGHAPELSGSQLTVSNGFQALQFTLIAPLATHFVVSSDASGGTLLTAAVGASIVAQSAVEAEGNSGTTAFTFAVSLDQVAATSMSVSWVVTGSGINPASAIDFAGGVLPSGVVTFATGEVTKTIEIQVAGDKTVEPDEGFTVVLSNPSAGLALGAASAMGTIQNDDVIAHSDAYVLKQGQSLIAAAGVLLNDESAITASLLAGSAHGTLQLSTNGSFSYTPAAGFSGVDSFTYHAATGSSSSSSSSSNSGGGGDDDAQALLYVVPVLVGSASTTLNLLALNAGEQIAATYAAFFGRAADAAGFAFWVNQFNINLPAQGGAKLFANIASSFGVSAEAKALYPFLANPFGASNTQISAFLDSVYSNLFNRSSDAAGLAYWTGQIKATLQAGQFVGSVLVNIMSGAQDTAAGKDITTLMGKVAVGLEFVHQEEQHGTVWSGGSDTASATTLLHSVTSDPMSVLTGIKNADSLIMSHP